MDKTENHSQQMKQFFDNCAENWDNMCCHNSDKVAAIITLAGIQKGLRVADIACGTGILFPEILKRDPELLLGIDLSSQMLEKARGKFNDPRLRLLAADFLDVNETGFDVTVIYSAYPHFPDKLALARHTAEILKTGGRFIIAHSEGKERINQHHKGNVVDGISWPLKPVKEEAEVWKRFFSIDLLADNNEFYLISGTKLDMGC